MSDTKLLVAAIDFGSSGAGYAFSFSYQFKTNPIDVQTSTWMGNSGAASKIPCVLLFDESKKFDCFGFDAEDKTYMVHMWLGNDILQMSANLNIRCLPVARRGNNKNRHTLANYFNCCTSRVHLLICIMDGYFEFDYHIDNWNTL
jgi:hypothetical protein